MLMFSTSLLNAQIDISDARSMSEGTVVTVKGIATNGAELSIIRYIQDDTGGIAVYPGTGSVNNFPNTVVRGTEVEVTGPLKFFNGLLEIDPVTSYTVISNNNPLPAPLVGTPDDVNQANEAKLMTINNVSFPNDAGNPFSVGNYTIQANGQTTSIYVRSNHPLIGTLIPLANINLTGICSVFNGNYQLLPRDEDDLEIADAFYISESHVQTNISQTGFTVSWKTNVAGSSNLRYGTDPSMLTDVNMFNNTTDHSITLTDLDPTTFYHVEVYSESGALVATSTQKLFSTASNSTGEVKVYFNHQVDANFSTGSHPSGLTPTILEAAIIERINAATSTIDVAMYNTNRDPIVAALTNAHNNGIQVRYIMDDETANLALQNPIPPFPTIKGNNGSPLMHNKFYIFDVDSQDDSWVIMGSTNMTSQNIATDFNNMVLIQDQAIAKAYEIEFEEMWGSDNATPGIFNLKFGENKANNTPHLFNVNGMMVESYFSPSDNTTLGIVNAVKSADDDLEFAILTFTNNELGSAVLDIHNDNVSVRGLINNINDQGSEFDYLQNNGVSVMDNNSTKQIHHKYAIIDATNTSSDPIVVTGSHNWSASAETRNDENTLIFHDAAVANIFLQEFEARWCEANGGTDCTLVSNKEVNRIDGFSAKVFPNPAIDHTNIEMNTESNKDVQIILWNANGQLLQSTILRNVQGVQTKNLSVAGLPAGTYLLGFRVDEQLMTQSLQIVR